MTKQNHLTIVLPIVRELKSSKVRTHLKECHKCYGEGYYIDGPDIECCGGSQCECGARGCSGPVQVDNRVCCEFCQGKGVVMVELK